MAVLHHCYSVSVSVGIWSTVAVAWPSDCYTPCHISKQGATVVCLATSCVCNVGACETFLGRCVHCLFGVKQNFFRIVLLVELVVVPAGANLSKVCHGTRSCKWNMCCAVCKGYVQTRSKP